MNGPTGFDRALADWLADAGAQDIPRRVIDAAVDTARHTRRARPLPAFITRWLPMSTTFPTTPPMAVPRGVTRSGRAAVFLIVALIALALIGAGLFAIGSPTPYGTVRNGLIAYDSNGDIWLADPDEGYATRQLTMTAATETSPVWSPDGTRIAYWSRGGGTSTVGIIDADGNVLREVTQPTGLELPEVGEPRWSPDGGTVAAVAGTDDHSTVLIDAATGDARALPMFVGLPSWSPDASHFAWGDGDANGDFYAPGVHVTAADGSDDRSISSKGIGPQFTPDGDRLVVTQVSLEGPDADIAIMNADGSNNHTIVEGPDNDRWPALSPDGTMVAFFRSDAANLDDCCGTNYADVYVTDIDGTDPPRLVVGRVGDWGSLAWSPEGDSLVAFNRASDAFIVASVDPAVEPVTIQSPGNVGILSWQRMPSD